MKYKQIYKNYDITHPTLGMLLHYLGKLKIQVFLQMWKKTQTNCIFNRLQLRYSYTNLDIFGV